MVFNTKRELVVLLRLAEAIIYPLHLLIFEGTPVLKITVVLEGWYEKIFPIHLKPRLRWVLCKNCVPYPPPPGRDVLHRKQEHCSACLYF